jgi:hypothetical protein
MISLLTTTPVSAAHTSAKGNETHSFSEEKSDVD